MEANYYAILGVPETADQEEIQEAYRRLAKAYHPDCSGADTAGQFQAVQEAWETLGSPERRRAYDAQRRPRRRFPSPPPREPHWPGPLFEESEAALHLELEMSPAEARRGGDVTVDLPAWGTCPHCDGGGQLMWYVCPACRGLGRGVQPERFTLNVPAGLGDGQVVHIPLREYQLVHRELVIHVRVA